MWKFKKVLFLMLGLLAFPLISKGEMTSTHYTIYADNFGIAGISSTSTSYNLQDTVGGISIGASTSSLYEIRAGYQAMEKGTLSLSVGSSSLNLGTLSSSTIGVASTTINITTDSATGYSLAVSSVSSQPLTPVSDGTVTAGSEEYGAAVSGANAAFLDDESIVASRVLATSASPVSNDQIIFTIKAAISGSTTPGAKSQSIVVGASANF